jgi:predicted DCC family thiol-disulfide oxidoreductase YuxK
MSADGSGDPPDGLVLFDGLCGFCSSGVNLALWLDRRGAFRFTPLQSPYGELLADRHSLDSQNPSTFFFFVDGAPLAKSDGVLAAAAHLPAPWRRFAVLRRTPRGWRDAAYDWVARNRYRLFGRRSSCRLPTPQERARFLLEPPA